MRPEQTRIFKMRKLLRQGDSGEGSTVIELLERTSIDRLEETALRKVLGKGLRVRSRVKCVHEAREKAQSERCAWTR